MASKRGTGSGGGPASPSMTVAEYSRQFFDRVLRKSYGPTEEDNAVVAGQKFCTLVKKLQDAASKDDVKVTLRVLRDEIGRVYFASSQEKRYEKIDTLFRLYDAVEHECQENLKLRGKEAQQATILLSELRDRFMRLAIGETWESFPELRLLALKRIQKYAVKENENLRLRGKMGMMDNSLSGNKAMGKGLRAAMTLGSSPTDTWQGVINNLGKAASSKLLPLLKALLLESYKHTEDGGVGVSAVTVSTPAVTTPGGEGTSTEPPSPASSATARELSTAASSASMGESAGHKMSELKLDINLDDLLGLNDPVPAPAAPTQDPFQLLAENGLRTPSTPVPSGPGPDFVSSAFSPQFAPAPASPAVMYTPTGLLPLQRNISNASSGGGAPPANPFGEPAAFPAFPAPSGVSSEPAGFAAAASGGFTAAPSGGFAAAAHSGGFAAGPPSGGFAAVASGGFGSGGFSGGFGSPAPATPSTPAPTPPAAPYSFPPVPLPSPQGPPPAARTSAAGFEGGTFTGGFADMVNTPFSQPAAGAGGPPAGVSPAGKAPAGFGESAFSPGFSNPPPPTAVHSSANPFFTAGASSAPKTSDAPAPSFSAW